MLRVILSFLIVLTLIGIVILVSFYNTFNWPNDYAVVFDAGSSGTRMYIYEWRADFSAARGDPLKVTQKLSCKPDDNGIDKIKSKSELISKFKACIEKADSEIPEDRKSRSYLFLAATAGMRLLEARNKTASDEILGFIREYFSELNFLYKNSSQVRIISGQEEGTNAWISANYYLNYFQSGDTKSYHSQGILDLGGASTQIVFVPARPNMNYSDYFSNIRIYGINYRPYSHSFLCWGVNEISLLYQTYLISSNDYTIKSLASCYPSGSNISLNSNQIFSSPCASGLIFNDTYNFTVNTSRIDRNQNYYFDGESQNEKCTNQIKIILPQPKCKYDSCSFDGVYQPSIQSSNFMGFSGFFYALNNTGNLLNEKFFHNMTAFKSATDKICSMSLDELKKLNKDNNAGLPEKFLRTQCFSNRYALQVLDNYGFKNFDHLKVSDTVNEYSLNWALGYLINELNRDDFLPYEEPPRKLKFSIFFPSTVICSLILMLLIAIFIYHRINLKSKMKQPNEETLLKESNNQENSNLNSSGISPNNATINV